MLWLSKQILCTLANAMLRRMAKDEMEIEVCDLLSFQVIQCLGDSEKYGFGGGARSLSCSEKDRSSVFERKTRPLIFETHRSLWKDKLWFKSVWLSALMIVQLCDKKNLVEHLSRFVDSMCVKTPYDVCTHPHRVLYPNGAFLSFHLEF